MIIPDSNSVLRHEILEKAPALVSVRGTFFATASEIAFFLSEGRSLGHAVSPESVRDALVAGDFPCVRGGDGLPVFWLQMPKRSSAGAVDFRPSEALQTVVNAQAGKPIHQPTNHS